MLAFNDIPFETRPSDERGYDDFEELVWRNSEICNSCFSRVRTIGPELTITLDTSKHRPLEYGPPQKITINEWYDRTDLGSQEHAPDTNPRFGTCFCLECGADCNGNHRHKSLVELKPLCVNIYEYVSRHTSRSLDPRAFGREVRELKQVPHAQGYETEIMAISFSRALGPDDRATSTASARPAVVSSD